MESKVNNDFKARNKLVYLLPPAALYIDLVGGTASLKEAVSQIFLLGETIAEMSPGVFITIFAAVIVVFDMLAGSTDYKMSFILGMISISVIPIFTISEGYNEIQNNQLIASIDEDFNLVYANISASIRYFGLALLSLAIHYLLFKEAKIILMGAGLLDINGYTKEDIDTIEKQRKRRNKDNLRFMGETEKEYRKAKTS